jgi:hypothetical protein
VSVTGKQRSSQNSDESSFINIPVSSQLISTSSQNSSSNLMSVSPSHSSSSENFADDVKTEIINRVKEEKDNEIEKQKIIISEKGKENGNEIENIDSFLNDFLNNNEIKDIPNDLKNNIQSEIDVSFIIIYLLFFTHLYNKRLFRIPFLHFFLTVIRFPLIFLPFQLL